MGGSGGNATGGAGGSASGSGGSTGGVGGSATGGGGLPLVYPKENTGADCPPPALPAMSALPTIANLPDPFLMSSGSRIASRADWRCRRAEIGAQIQNYELGAKPAPPSNLTATFSAGRLTVNVTDGGGSITLTTTITTPSGAGPFPAIIGMDTGGTGSLPSSIFTSRGIATMTFTSSQLTPQLPNRGQGAIYGLYPDAGGLDDPLGVGRQPHHRRAREDRRPEQDRPHAAFVDKFLVGMTNATSPYRTDLSRWITWSTPQLQ